ncbi:hypothetical protein BLNAU_2900 [Blattamonas nauphoetae]|uniref:Uncharacterized protein n=1 Tax=Blattamonas nauphoetae TaxID=2049346 RepID=A0ABQ9YF08_9EUKA|nr:hypothetical protein BLNAU_2900 [Blattamonas nauphoetae]
MEGKAQFINLELLIKRTFTESHVNSTAPEELLSELYKSTRLDLSNERISVITNLELFSQLKALHLQHNDISDIDTLAVLSSLTYLSLSHNNIDDISSLTDLPLVFLDVSYNKIETLDPHLLSLSPSLCYLRIEGNPVSHTPHLREKLIKQYPRLRVLNGIPVTKKEHYLYRKGQDIPDEVLYPQVEEDSTDDAEETDEGDEDDTEYSWTTDDEAGDEQLRSRAEAKIAASQPPSKPLFQKDDTDLSSTRLFQRTSGQNTLNSTLSSVQSHSHINVKLENEILPPSRFSEAPSKQALNETAKGNAKEGHDQLAFTTRTQNAKQLLSTLSSIQQPSMTPEEVQKELDSIREMLKEKKQEIIQNTRNKTELNDPVFASKLKQVTQIGEQLQDDGKKEHEEIRREVLDDNKVKMSEAIQDMLSIANERGSELMRSFEEDRQLLERLNDEAQKMDSLGGEKNPFLGFGHALTEDIPEDEWRKKEEAEIDVGGRKWKMAEEMQGIELVPQSMRERKRYFPKAAPPRASPHSKSAEMEDAYQAKQKEQAELLKLLGVKPPPPKKIVLPSQIIQKRENLKMKGDLESFISNMLNDTQPLPSTARPSSSPLTSSTPLSLSPLPASTKPQNTLNKSLNSTKSSTASRKTPATQRTSILDSHAIAVLEGKTKLYSTELGGTTRLSGSMSSHSSTRPTQPLSPRQPASSRGQPTAQTKTEPKRIASPKQKTTARPPSPKRITGTTAASRTPTKPGSPGLGLAVSGTGIKEKSPQTATRKPAVQPKLKR